MSLSSNPQLKYAGIGSRETPKAILAEMREFAYQAARQGHILRSGAAPGADSAFEIGCVDAVGPMEIFLPWAGFCGRDSKLYPLPEKAKLIAAEIHPAWRFMKPSGQRLVARNMQQILGADLDDPVSCVVCWTRDGCESIESYSVKTGGTGSAIALASVNNIPVFNLCNTGRLEKAREHLLKESS